MTKEKKTFEGKIDGIIEVTETKKEGLFRFGVKANKDWYGFSGKLKECQNEHATAQEAKDKGYVVEFEYTDDGKWLNITKAGSWNVESGKDKHEPASTRPSDRQQEAHGAKEKGEGPGGVLINKDLAGDSDRPEIPVPEGVKAREKKIAEAHEVDMVKEKVARRRQRITHQTECLEDAVVSYRNVTELCTTTDGSLDETDKRNIRAIANGFMAEDGRKGRG